MRKLFVILGLGLLLFIAVGGYMRDSGSTDTPAKKSDAQIDKKDSFGKQQKSLTDPDSIWIVVNKQRPLVPQNYAPGDLVDPGLPARTGGIKVRQELATPLKKLFDAAEANKTPLRLSSGYRSFSYQVGLYNGYVSKEGQVAADAESARPGYSEHQTGLAVDVGPADGFCNVELCFADKPAGKWLAAQGHRYGFIVRYPETKTAVTGYEFEPWHIRYVGVPLATEMHNQNSETMEEFFGLPAAPNY